MKQRNAIMISLFTVIIVLLAIGLLTLKNSLELMVLTGLVLSSYSHKTMVITSIICLVFAASFNTFAPDESLNGSTSTSEFFTIWTFYLFAAATFKFGLSLYTNMETAKIVPKSAPLDLGLPLSQSTIADKAKKILQD